MSGISQKAGGGMGTIEVVATQGRGQTPEEIAERAIKKIVSVGDNSHPLVAEQARAFEAQIKQVLVMYLYEAVRANKVTLANKFRQAGHPELVKLLDE